MAVDGEHEGGRDKIPFGRILPGPEKFHPIRRRDPPRLAGSNDCLGQAAAAAAIGVHRSACRFSAQLRRCTRSTTEVVECSDSRSMRWTRAPTSSAAAGSEGYRATLSALATYTSGQRVRIWES